MGTVDEEPRRRHPSAGSKASSNGSWSSFGSARRLSFAQKRQQESSKGPCEKIVHRPQDSLFSSSSGWTNYRGFFNLAMLLLVVSNGRVALENLIKYGILISPLKWLSFLIVEGSFGNWPNLALVIFSNITILVVFVTEKILEKGFLSNYFAGIFYPILVSAHLITPAAITLFLDGNPLCSVFALSIFVIESLKIVSYVHVNYWCRCAREEKIVESKKDDITKLNVSGSEMTSLYPSTLTLSNLYYFMLAPTLCYELKFPKSVRRRKTFLMKRLVELVFLSFLMASLIQQWVVPTVRNSMKPLSEMEFGRCLERLLKLAIPNIIIWLIGFYTIFHAALNFMAEILKFADREFYRDFWNSETIQYFWRTWNIPVHRWAARHVYLPMIRNNYSKLSAMVAVFFVSAFFHEYLVSVPLHMFRLWAYYGMMAQIPLSFITDYIVKGGRAGNVIVWLSLILGQPLAILMYVHDWYVMHQDVPEATMISMYKTLYDGRTYFVYWLPDPKVLGVCNGVNEVYESAVSEKDRAEFVNVSESILPTIWRENMFNKAFIVSSISSDSHCTITFGTKRSLTLAINNDPLRLSFIMEEMLKCIESLTDDQNKKQKKRTPTVVPVKRRKPATKGIKWEED
ncbi:MBOAT family protein [Necator americanus]|uniref:O-acyltransferase n=1 Tax=Necator americanus TaxID=51031 RepID=W2SFF0_NECAM|nr:MBOAT family protein [Necator americanus]ETN68334.1 MBOAT family protein [Necator americanus]